MKQIRYALLAVATLVAGVGFQPRAIAETSRLQHVVTYLQPGTTHPDKNYLTEFIDSLTAAHLGPEFFGQVRGTLKSKQAIVDLADELFNYKDDHLGELLPNYQVNWNTVVEKYLKGHEDKILAFYIADEPSDYGITRESLETVIKMIKSKYPEIPTYIIWDQNCFDNSSELDAKCRTKGRRGIPENVDWVGFDWYLRNEPEKDEADFNANIVPALERLKSLTKKPIFLVPDGTDQFLKKHSEADRDKHMARRFKMFYDLAQKNPQVIGLDNYAWADHTEILRGVNTYVIGTRQFPETKKLLFQYAEEAKKAR